MEEVVGRLALDGSVKKGTSERRESKSEGELANMQGCRWVGEGIVGGPLESANVTACEVSRGVTQHVFTCVSKFVVREDL